MTTPTTKSNLLPWLDVVASKRKKQVISPDDFNFDQLGPIKNKVTKKPKTMSRILVDLVSKKKYDEVLVSSSYKDKENIQPVGYTMQTVELGIETHESVKQDSQTAFNSLMHRFDQERDEKNEWKQKCEQLTSILHKRTQPSQEVQPIVSSVNTKALKKVK